MASLTIRNLDDDLKRKLRVRAAHRNRSMEDEARDILRTALAQEPAETRNLADAIRELVEPLGGVAAVAIDQGVGLDAITAQYGAVHDNDYRGGASVPHCLVAAG